MMNLIGHPPVIGGSKTLIDQLGQNDLVLWIGKQARKLFMTGFFLRSLQLMGSILPLGGQPNGFFNKLVGIFHHTPRYVRAALSLIVNRQIDAEALISHEMPLERLEEALQLLASGDTLKVAIIP